MTTLIPQQPAPELAALHGRDAPGPEDLPRWLAEQVVAQFDRPLPNRNIHPGDRDSQLAQSLRIFKLGREREAFRAVFDLIHAYPDWAEAHICAGQLLAQSGALEAFETFLAARVAYAGKHIGIVAACLRMLSDAGLHARLQKLLPGARAIAGDHLFFTLLEAVAASETGDLDRADRLFAAAQADGGGLSLPHVAHLMRRGRATEAAAAAERFVEAYPTNQGGWGMLATAWRLTGDPRHAWLVEQPGLVRTIDVEVPPGAMDALAVQLRTLHVARTHPFDQSLRGGTQTSGYLLRRKEPEIRLIRHALTTAIRRYINQLPPADPRHPLLGQKRDIFQFTDSWSVRLLDGGWHLSHVHPMGSLSSALYVSLPPPCPDDPHAGWLTLGAPPEDLRTGLTPLMLVEPKVGRLAIFPSFLWHGTLPFPKGERMTIAFDTVLNGPTTS